MIGLNPLAPDFTAGTDTPEVTSGARYADLESKGFLVLPSFLSERELQEVRADYNSQPADAVNQNYSGLSMASKSANQLLTPRVRQVLERVMQQTSLRVDAPSGAAYFATGGGVNFAWHQDHESFFAYQNHFDYMNFFIPIIKPSRDKSNLSIVPFDRLERESPATFRKVARSGAARFIRAGRKRIVFLDDSGRVHLMREDIEQLAYTPLLSAGDLLLMRGDMIHRTQDAETRRVALSFRVFRASTVVTRARLADGGWHKARMMAKNAAVYERMFRAFDVAGKDELRVDELSRAMAAVQLPGVRTPQQFLMFLLGQKRKSRVLARFLPRIAISVMAGRLASLYDRLVPAAPHSA